MDAILGLLRIKVRIGINLAIRDAGSASSDPYVVITMGSQVFNHLLFPLFSFNQINAKIKSHYINFILKNKISKHFEGNLILDYHTLLFLYRHLNQYHGFAL